MWVGGGVTKDVGWRGSKEGCGLEGGVREDVGWRGKGK